MQRKRHDYGAAVTLNLDASRARCGDVVKESSILFHVAHRLSVHARYDVACPQTGEADAAVVLFGDPIPVLASDRKRKRSSAEFNQVQSWREG